MTKKIVGVLGLGIFGRTVAFELSHFDQGVIALDNGAAHVQEVADYVAKAAVGDITDFDFLKAVGIDQYAIEIGIIELALGNCKVDIISL